MSVSVTKALLGTGLSYQIRDNGSCVVIHSHPTQEQIEKLDVKGVKQKMDEINRCNSLLMSAFHSYSDDPKLQAAISAAVDEHGVKMTMLRVELFKRQWIDGTAPSRWICP